VATTGTPMRSIWPWKRLRKAEQEIAATNKALRSLEDYLGERLFELEAEVEAIKRSHDDIKERVVGPNYTGVMTKQLGGLSKEVWHLRWALINIHKGFDTGKRHIYGKDADEWPAS
jgi:hypothetical protein